MCLSRTRAAPVLGAAGAAPAGVHAVPGGGAAGSSPAGHDDVGRPGADAQQCAPALVALCAVGMLACALSVCALLFVSKADIRTVRLLTAFEVLSGLGFILSSEMFPFTLASSSGQGVPAYAIVYPVAACLNVACQRHRLHGLARLGVLPDARAAAGDPNECPGGGHGAAPAACVRADRGDDGRARAGAAPARPAHRRILPPRDRGAGRRTHR